MAKGAWSRGKGKEDKGERRGIGRKDKIEFFWAHFVSLYSTRMNSVTRRAVTELVWI